MHKRSSCSQTQQSPQPSSGLTGACIHGKSPALTYVQVVAGAGALAVAVWLAQAYLLPPVARWWRGADREPSPADKAAAAVAAAIQAQVALLSKHIKRGLCSSSAAMIQDQISRSLVIALSCSPISCHISQAVQLVELTPAILQPD